MNWRARLKQREEGALLILALIFLSLFSVIVLALLGFTDTSLIQTNAAVDQRRALYSSDGAISGAILNGFSSFQSNLASIRAGNAWACPSFSLQNSNQITADVTCTVSGTTLNGDTSPRPANAILTLGGSISVRNSGTLRVTGDVHSNSNIDVRDRNGILSVVGKIRSRVSPCPKRGRGTVTSTINDKVCSTSVASVADPNYKTAVLTAPTTVATVPTTCATKLVTFTAPAGGLVFNDALALTKLTNRTYPSCRGAVVWFKPGLYYFNFGNNSNCQGQCNDDDNNTPHQWRVSDSRMAIVGGAAQGGWDTNLTLRPSVPGGCNTSVTGAQFVYGGDSSMRMTNGTLEICPATGSDGHKISFYGARSTANGYTAGRGTVLTTNRRATVVLQGTLYAPLQSVTLDTSRIFTPIIGRGLIAKSATLQASRVVGPTAFSMPPTPVDVLVVVDLASDVAGNTAVKAQVTYKSTTVGGTTTNSYDVITWAATRG
jgi:Tfp pilus assembly protein PilV